MVFKSVFRFSGFDRFPLLREFCNLTRNPLKFWGLTHFAGGQFNGFKASPSVDKKDKEQLGIQKPIIKTKIEDADNSNSLLSYLRSHRTNSLV